MLNLHFDTVAGLLLVLIALGVVSHNNAITHFCLRITHYATNSLSDLFALGHA